MVANATEIATPNAGLQRLERIFDLQTRAFRATPYPDVAERREHLARLMDLLSSNRERFVAAVDQDFGHRSAHETLSAEIMVGVEGARFARARVRRWMKPRRAHIGALMLSTSARVEYQPKGVVGIIAPWNYPIYMVVGPLAYALAAGNRVMIKPSEFTPATSALMQELFAAHFAEDHVAVVTGEEDIGIRFTKLPFDHLLFTGSTGVGRHVMRAAAENLTPVTLELGGKSPTVITPDVDLDMAADRICFGKALNAGQTCVAPDYILCPQGLQEPLVEALRSAFAKFYPSVRDNDDYTSIVNDRQYERLQELLHDARTREARVEICNPAGESFDGSDRKMPLHILLNVGEDMRVMQEEIFGPLLPVVPYEHIDDAIDYINRRPRPLALNYFDNDRARTERFMRATHSGAFLVNDAVFHVAVDDLPFGGSGDSGMGRYHGREGFLTFSNQRGFFRRPRWFNSARVMQPPYRGRLLSRLHDWVFR